MPLYADYERRPTWVARNESPGYDVWGRGTRIAALELGPEPKGISWAASAKPHGYHVFVEIGNWSRPRETAVAFGNWPGPTGNLSRIVGTSM